MVKNRKTPDMNLPVWFDGQNINEALFCEEFLQERRIIFANRAFFTPDGRVTDDIFLLSEVYEKLKNYTISSVPQKIKNIMELLKLEAIKRDNNNIFDFMDSEGYIRRKADVSISSKDFYAIYRLWCEENSLAPLKSRSFSDAMVANAKKFNLEHCNNIANSAGRRVWGFMGVEAVARPNINGFYDASPCTYVPEEWQD